MCILAVFFGTTVAFAQGTVTGTVTDDNDIPILGATVQVQGTSNGVVTDDNGMYSIQASNGDVLVFSYIGFGRKKIEVTGTTINVQLIEDIGLLDEVIVSSTRKPVRKLQATTAVNSLGAQDIAIKNPESITEAIENVPGITVDNSQGRKGGFNIRGFPAGSIYTTTLIDGLPTSALGNLASGTLEFYGLDPNVERIEVVRGAAATLFGRSAAAGAINIISKTGGKEHAGSFSFTKFNNTAGAGHKYEDEFDYKTDFNFNGPISEKLRYNIGGLIINDSGQKEQANKDLGHQIRANFDWLISDNSNIRFYGAYLNNQFQNITDTPWDLGREAPGGGFLARNTFYTDPEQLQFDTEVGGFLGTTPDAQNRLIRQPGDFRERVAGWNVGLDATFGLGSNWSFNQKLRLEKFDFDDINEFTSTGFYNDTDASVSRLLAAAEQQNEGLISETRITKDIIGENSTHSLNGGVYYSDGERDRLGYLYFYSSTVELRPTFGPATAFGIPFTAGAPGILVNSSLTSGHREEQATGVFVGDEMVFNDKLSVNVAFRYDWLRGQFINDPDEITRYGVDLDRAPDAINDIDEKFSDWSGSIGLNYLVGENSAIYANFLRAFSFPSVENNNFVRPEGTEIVNNFEIGYRAGLGDITLDFTGFNSRLNNRISFIFDSATNEFIQAPAGSNKILGGEFAITYTPKALKGLLLNGSLTYQKSEYVDFLLPLSLTRDGSATVVDQTGNLFGLNLVGSGVGAAVDLEGNQVQRTPKLIYNVNLGYSGKRWGANFNGFTYTGVFGDATNLLEQPNLSIYNLGGYVTFPIGENELRFTMLVKNIFDGNNPVQLGISSGDDSTLIERQANPTNVDGRLAFATLQNPKRVLFTIGYRF